MKHLLIAACVLLAGCAALRCAALPGDPSKMTPEQLKASARDKNSAVACTAAKTVTGNVTTVYVNVDQAVGLGSQVTVDADCRTTINATSGAASAGVP